MERHQIDRLTHLLDWAAVDLELHGWGRGKREHKLVLVAVSNALVGAAITNTDGEPLSIAPGYDATTR